MCVFLSIYFFFYKKKEICICMKHLVQAFALCFINPQFYRVQAFVPIILPEILILQIFPHSSICVQLPPRSNPER